MKCDELKAIRGGDIHDLVKFGDGSEIYHDETLYYLKNAADEVLAAKDDEIERQNTEIKEAVKTMKSQEEEIVQLKQKLMPCLNGDCILTCEVVEKYGKENAELKQKLEDAKATTAYAESVDAGMRERRLKRAFLLALAHKAKYKKYWYCELLKQEGSKILSDNKKAKKYNAIIKMCQECEVKCLKKAEEYK